MTSTPAWTRESIEALLASNPLAVYRAVLAIYARQTAEEKAKSHTLEANGVGFGGADAVFFSKVAKRLLAGEAIPADEFPEIHRRIRRYSKQLLGIALAASVEKQLIAAMRESPKQ